MRHVWSIALAAASLACSASVGFAQERTAARAKSGAEVRVGGGWNCSNPTVLPQVAILKSPSQGTASVVEVASGSPCKNGPMMAIMYRSKPGFKGTDEISYQVTFPGRSRSTQSIERKIQVQ